MFGKYITLHKLRNIILGGFEEGWESFREREVRPPCFSRTLFVGGGETAQINYWPNARFGCSTHTHYLSLSSIGIYIQGARWAKVGERNVMQHDWRGGGSGDLENITESLMAAGGQGKGPRFETKRRARILANEEKDLYLLFFL